MWEKFAILAENHEFKNSLAVKLAKSNFYEFSIDHFTTKKLRKRSTSINLKWGFNVFAQDGDISNENSLLI